MAEPTNDIILPGARPAVSVQEVGDRNVVYTGITDPKAPQPTGELDLASQVTGALAEVFGATPAAAADLSSTYGQRLEGRDQAADAAELEALDGDVQRDNLLQGAGDAAKDVAKGLVLEGVPAVFAGANTAINETLDGIEAVADQVPFGVITYSGFDGDPATPHKIEAMSGREAKAKGFAGAAQRFLPKLPFNNDTAPVETHTGKFVEKASQFVTGMAGAGKLLKGWSAATKAGMVGKSLAQGAIADFTAFDGHEARLSDMLKAVSPEVAKPVFEFLSSNSNDPELLGRAKNAVEGLGLGAATESVFGAIKAVRAARQAKTLASQQARAAGYQTVALDATEQAAQDAGVAADVDALLKMTPAQLKKRAISAKVNRAAETTGRSPKDITAELVDQSTPAAADNVFDLKLDTIETADDIKGVITKLAKKYSPEVDAARRGTRSWEQTGEAAESVDWVESMAKRKTGDAVNAETLFAYREALNASASKVLGLAQIVENGDGSVAAQYAFRKALALHHAIQLEFMGARAEAGRALNAMKIPAGAPANRVRQIDNLLQELGGKGTVDELAAKILKAANEGDVALNEMVKGGWQAHTRAMVKLVRLNGMLSGPATAVVNVVGNTANLLQNLAARHLAPRLEGASEAEVGDATALLHAYLGTMKDAFHAMGKGLRSGAFDMEAVRQKGVFGAATPGLGDLLPEGLRKPVGREEAGSLYGTTIERRPLSAAAFKVDEDSTLGRALDVAQAVMESPSNINQVSDDFFRALAGRGELRAQAFRQAQKELKSGALPNTGNKAVQARMKELLDNPSKEMLDAAEREMQDLTFTRVGGFDKALTNIRRMIDDNTGPVGVGSILFPFIRTPANLVSTAMQYSPLAHFSARARANLAAGGATAEIAKAKIAVGTMLWASYLEMAFNGVLTGPGPSNPEQRAALAREDGNGTVTWQPYSVKVGDRFFGFQRVDPLATGMVLAGSYADLAVNGDWNNAQYDQLGELGGHAVLALGEAFFDKTMLTSAAELNDVLLSNNPAQAERYIANQTATFVPFSGGLRAVRRIQDPYMREVTSVLDALRNTLPGTSDDLAPARDLWGKPRTYQSGLGVGYDFLNLTPSREFGGSAIDGEIMRNGVSVKETGGSVSIDGQTVSLRNRPDIQSELDRMAGEPAYAKLEAVAKGEDPFSDTYFDMTDGPNGGKADYIKQTVRAYRNLARQKIVQQYGDELRGMAAQSRLAKEQARANN